MSLMMQPLHKYADFTGRARRAEYWLFALFNFLMVCLASLLGGDTLVALLVLGLVIPNIALGVRRLHDFNLSGWFYLLTFIPFATLVLGLIPGDVGDNDYGPQPE
jgi:uncharacterized membrane protein YhaH (DUF805 family)